MLDSSDETVLVTGATGFIAGHIILQLLQSGALVRGTVRTQAKANALREMLRQHDTPTERLELVPLDLSREEGWLEAASGCRYVLHTASPFPITQPRDRMALVPAAKNGTIRACRAAIAAGAERLVLTSSVAAVVYGHADQGTKVFAERDFSNVDSPRISPYALSKTLAEQAAWHEMAKQSGSQKTGLSVINPALVLGPVLYGPLGSSTQLVSMLMRGKIPALPRLNFGVVDVRDVAEAHIRAMRQPAAENHRFILNAETIAIQHIADVLKREFPELQRNLTVWTIPDWPIRIASFFSRQAAALAGELGHARLVDTAPAQSILGLRFRSADEAILSLAHSLRRLDLVPTPN